MLLAPDEGERAEDVDALAARADPLGAVKARHALTVVDIGATVTEATAIAAEMANQVLVVTTPDVPRCAASRLRDLWKRLQVREDDEDVLRRAQPRLAQARGPARPGAQGRRRARWPRRRSPPTSPPSRRPSTRARRRAWRTGSCAELRRAARRGSTWCPRSARTRHRPGGAARPARPARRRARPDAASSSWACCRSSRS